MHAVEGEQVGVRLHAAQVVDGDRHDVLPPALDDGAQDQAPDTSKSVDRDLYGHGLCPFCCVRRHS